MHKRYKAMRVAGLLLAGGVVSGCLSSSVLEPPSLPSAQPDAAHTPPPAPLAASPTSQALSLFYARLQNDLEAQDLMRTGGGGIDTPFTDTDLARNFERIAFFNEYQNDGSLTPSDGVPGRLRKWGDPVRIGVEFGARVPLDNRARDLESIRAYAARLSSITGHPISVSDGNPNFIVMIMSADDNEQARLRAQQILPSFQTGGQVFFDRLPRSIRCFVIAAGLEDEYEYRMALTYIRSENTALQRLACIHEELAQGLGLANDSPKARPSIFNDDEEFALLTTHDEILLQTLYDPSLAAGASIEEARPVIARILAKLTGPS